MEICGNCCRSFFDKNQGRFVCGRSKKNIMNSQDACAEYNATNWKKVCFCGGK